MIDIAGYAAEIARASQFAWNLPVERLSASSFTMARRCPRQWQERYVHGRKERPAEAPVVGSAVHAALKQNFEQKISSHEDLPTVELLDWYSEVGFPTTVVDGEQMSGSETFWTSDPESARTRGRVMLGAYHNAVSPRIQPTAAEARFEIDMGLPVPVIGFLDVEEQERTIDFKTGKARRSKPKEDWKIQAAIYNEARGRPVEFHTIGATEGKMTASVVTPLESPELLIWLDEGQRRVLREGVRLIAAELCMYMELLGPDEPWPMHGTFSEWACNYCGYRKDCPAWEHER